MSSKEVLSQDEIDVLLDNADAVAAKSRSGLKAPFEIYDIFSPRAGAHSELPDLSRSVGYISRELAKSLETLVAYPVEVSTDSDPGLVEASEFRQSLDNPSAIATVAISDFEDTFTVVFDPFAIRSLVSALFGGDGSVTRGADEFTATEMRIAQRVLGIASSLLAKAISDGKAATVHRIDTNPATLSGAAANEILAFMTFSIRVGTSEGRCQIIIPESALTTLGRAHDTTPGALDDRQWRQNLINNTSDAAVLLQARVAQVRLTIGDLLRLAPGDFIPVDIDRSVLLCADERPLLRGVLGVSGAMNAVHVTGPANQAETVYPELPFHREANT